MCPNIRLLFTLVSNVAVLILMFSLQNSHALASQGTELAKAMLQKIQSTSTRDGVDSIVQEAALKKSRLTGNDRIDYVEYLLSLLDSGTEKAQGELSLAVMRLIPDGVSEQEVSAGEARLLSSGNPAVRARGENLDLAPWRKLPNGETGQDISVFDLALHDPKVPKDRLIRALFKIAPAETAQWMADHDGLSANERASIAADLQKAWKMHRANNDPSADKETKSTLDDSVKNPLLARWLQSPSWVLRGLANGFLEKHPHWQTQELKKAMKPVEIPPNLQLSSPTAPSASK